jgi:hypothetical protein
VTDHAPDDPVDVLRRWEDFGAVWQVVARTPEQVTVSLRRCDAGEEVTRLVSDDPALRAYVEEREAETR